MVAVASMRSLSLGSAFVCEHELGHASFCLQEQAICTGPKAHRQFRSERVTVFGGFSKVFCSVLHLSSLLVIVS